MTWFDWLVFVSGIAAVWLTVRQHLLNWPIGIANSLAVLVVAVQHKLYADGALQVVYVVLGLYGWWHWYYGNPARHDALPVVRTPAREVLPLAVATALTYLMIAGALRTFTDSDVPWLDAFPTTASLLAQYLLTRKYLANWAVWIFAVNVPFAALYVYKGLYLLALLQPIYVALSVAGWRTWRLALAAPDPDPRDAQVAT
jgi:nicotinamide mononucleotide transporter